MYEALRKYLPANSFDYINSILSEEKVQLHIKTARYSKWGDYRHPFRGQGHRISLNADLNPYAFLITLCHELGHLYVWNTYKNSVKPHGKEWQQAFRMLMLPLMEHEVFPKAINQHLYIHMKAAKATASADLHLLRLLKAQDEKQETLLEELEEGQQFVLENGHPFVKGPLRKKRFHCTSLKNGKAYLVHPLAVIKMFAPKN
jgi:hypothetical protein